MIEIRCPKFKPVSYSDHDFVIFTVILDSTHAREPNIFPEAKIL